MRAPPRLVRLFSFAVIDQALLSGANFLVAFLLIRHSTGPDYGLFVLLQATIMALVVAQGSWVSGPLYVLLPKKSSEDRRQMAGAIGASQRIWFRRSALLAVVVPPAGYLLGFWDANLALIGFIGIFAAWGALLREYNRTILLCYSRSRKLLSIDAVYAALLVGLALVVVFAPREATIAGYPLNISVAALAALALAISAAIAAAVAYRELDKDPGWTGPIEARAYWREMLPLGIWASVGSSVYWLFSQSYNYVIASQIGLDAVADVNAVRLLTMPVILITVGVRSLLIPSAASWLVEHGVVTLMRRLAAFVAGIAVLDLIYFALVWGFRDWLTVDLMHRHIVELDLLLLLWFGVALAGLGRDIFMAGLQALERFKIVAFLTALGAVVALATMWFAIPHWGAAGTLIGQLVGEGVILVGTILLTLQSKRRARGDSAPESASASLP